MKNRSVDEFFRVFLPVARGSEIAAGDYFVVTDVKHPEYEVVYQCTHISSEHRICNGKYDFGYHCLNVEKVALFECSIQVGIGDEVIVKYNIHLPGIITRRFFRGIIVNDSNDHWLLVDEMGFRCSAPKKYTFKIVKQLEFNSKNHGILRTPPRRLRTRSPS